MAVRRKGGDGTEAGSKVDKGSGVREGAIKKPEKAERRDERRDVMLRAKKVWEDLRVAKKGSPKVQQLVEQLWEMLKGRLLEFVWRHDGSRIVQWMVGAGSRDQRGRVIAEISEGCGREGWARLVGDRYARHLALKIVRVGGKEVRERVFSEFVSGSVPVLMKGTFSADFVDVLFQTVLNSVQRSLVVMELLFAREKKLFDTVVRKLESENSQGARSKLTFRDGLDSVGSVFSSMVLQNAGSYLTSLTEKDSLVRLTVAHAALLEYLTTITGAHGSDDTTVASAASFAQLLAPSLVHLTHSKPGAILSTLALKLLQAKHRKIAVRSLKTHVRKIIEDDSGHIVLLALFSLVDDTVLLNKLNAEILSPSALTAQSSRLPSPEKRDFSYVRSLCSHPHGRMLIIYLLHGPDSRYFNPDAYGSIWQPLPEPFPNFSKKDPDLRRRELREPFLPVFKRLCEAENLSKLMSSVKSSPIAIGLCACDETREWAAAGLGEVLSGAGKEVLNKTCGWKTAVAMVKVGDAKVASAVVEQSAGIVLQTQGKLAEMLLRKSGDKTVARMVVERKDSLEKGSEGLVEMAEEVLK